MNKRSFTSLLAASLQKSSGFGLATVCVIALVSVASQANAAPNRSYGGGLSSHGSVSINVGNRGYGGHYGGHYRGGHNYYGGYGGRGYGYGSYGWGGWNGWGGLYTGLALGLALPVLANGYSSSWYGGAPYYYADDGYYVSYPRRDYRVLSPSERVITERYVYESPSPEPVVAAPPMSGAPTPSYVRDSSPSPSTKPAQTLPQLYAYPKNGQSATQSTFDRIECERWGSGQTGYSPGQSAEDANRKADYQRAVSACLEGRGYTVK